MSLRRRLISPAAEEAQSLADGALTHYGHIDILVNNAGMIQVGGANTSLSFDQLSEEQWDYGIAINLKTMFNATKAVLPAMLAAGYGRVVNVSSVTGPVASNPRETVYSAAKAGMVGFTRSLGLEVARKGITVNAVAPGWIETASSTDEEIVAGKKTPIGRPGRPEEVAAAIAFLCSDGSFLHHRADDCRRWRKYNPGVQRPQRTLLLNPCNLLGEE
jgi:3-oxoacyl-[acyl-carrier protein] reductase